MSRSKDIIEDIMTWNNVGKVPIDNTPHTKERGLKLIKEEFQELLSAENRGEELDALCDMMVVIIGHARSMQFDIGGAMGEVSDSNWSKFPEGLDQKDIDAEIKFIEETRKQKGVYTISSGGFTVFKNSDGKIVKPSQTRKPNLKGFV